MRAASVVGVACALVLAASAAAQESEPAVRAAGTAIVRGRVVAAADGRALGRAVVTLQSESSNGHRVVADEHGAFAIEAPAGRYGLRASAAGYLTFGLGQSLPSDPPQVLDLKPGEIRSGVEIALPDGGAIEVRVVDESGAAVEGAYVTALATTNGERVMPIQIGDKQGNYGTDDHGVIRVYDLEPGEYFLSATASSALAVPGNSRGRRAIKQVQAFYPGVLDLADALPVLVGLGEKIRVDLVMPPPFTARRHRSAGAITVHVTDDAGYPVVGADVRALEVHGEGESRTVARARTNTVNVSRGWENKAFFTDDRGDVRIYGLPAGEYLVVVAQPGPTYFPGAVSRANAHAISIRPWDDINIEIALAQPRKAQVSGRVERWDGEPARMSVALEHNHQGPLYQSGFVDDTIATAELVDGEFTFPDVPPGDYIIRTTYDPDSDARDSVGEIAITVDGEDVVGVLLKTVRRR